MKKEHLNFFKSIVLIFSCTIFLSFVEDESFDDGTGSARYCRCKPNHYEKACLAGNAISFRPICQQGGGDCGQSDNNC